MTQGRFSRQRNKFSAQIVVLDELQKSDGIAPGTKKWEDFQWVLADSEFVTKTRNQSDELMLIIDSYRHCPPETKDKMELLIDEFMKYDHDRVLGRRLLDKIALNGTIDDWEKLGIKRGTSLAKAPVQGHGNILVSKVRASISLRSNSELLHILIIRNVDTPDSSALPEGIKRAQVYCYIGKVAPTKYSQYELIGNAKRGIYKHFISGLEPSTDRIYAWYYVRYESNRGELLEPGSVLKAEIYFPVA